MQPDQLIEYLNNNPNCAKSHCALAKYFFSIKNIKEALTEWQWRFKCRNLDDDLTKKSWNYWSFYKKYKDKWWNGEGELKNALVIADEGLGDAIQYCRYLKGLDVFVLVPEVLTSLFANSFKMTNESNVEFVVPMSNLPYYFDSELDKKIEFPYLKSSAIVPKLESNKLKVGLVWAGSKFYEADRYRSYFLREFSWVFQEDIDVFSLQIGDMVRTWALNGSIFDGHDDIKVVDLMEGAEHFKMTRLEPKDFNETAAYLNQLDVLISVDTSIIHLAGALGVKTAVFLPKNNLADWRWGSLDKNINIYPSLKFFKFTKKVDITKFWDTMNRFGK